ncbi:MAG: hypothetical protein J5600_01695, partial [Desulfovibrio sp.]|nr:hypothetical protein [Desulfovibrio sp.]
MIDLTERPEAGVGSEVEIFGVKSSRNALAAAAQTIPYELLCAVSKRVPRVYLSKWAQTGTFRRSSRFAVIERRRGGSPPSLFALPLHVG